MLEFQTTMAPRVRAAMRPAARASADAIPQSATIYGLMWGDSA